MIPMLPCDHDDCPVTGCLEISKPMTTPQTDQWHSLRDNPPASKVKAFHTIRLVDNKWQPGNIWNNDYAHVSYAIDCGMTHWSDATPPPLPPDPDPAEEAWHQYCRQQTCAPQELNAKSNFLAGYKAGKGVV